MSDQTIQVKYVGTVQRWPELSITGRQSAWMPGQIESRAPSEATALLATGLFSSPPVPVTAVTSPGGGNRLLAGNLPADMVQLSNVVVAGGLLQSWTANGIDYVATYSGGKVATVTASDGWVQTYAWAGDVPTITVAKV